MSMLACSYCGDFADTDDGEGHWDVAILGTDRKYEFVCGVCAEKHINEDEVFDHALPEKSAYHDKGEAMAALAEDQP